MNTTKVYLKSGSVIETSGDRMHAETTTQGGVLTHVTWKGITGGERSIYLDLSEVAAITETINLGAIK